MNEFSFFFHSVLRRGCLNSKNYRNIKTKIFCSLTLNFIQCREESQYIGSAILNFFFSTSAYFVNGNT